MNDIIIHTEKEIVENWCFSGNSFSTYPITKIRVFRKNLKKGHFYAVVKGQYGEFGGNNRIEIVKNNIHTNEKNIYYAPLNSLEFIGKYIDIILQNSIIYTQFSYMGNKVDLIYGINTYFFEVNPPSSPFLYLPIIDVFSSHLPPIKTTLPNSDNNQHKRYLRNKQGSITYNNNNTYRNTNMYKLPPNEKEDTSIPFSLPPLKNTIASIKSGISKSRSFLDLFSKDEK